MGKETESIKVNDILKKSLAFFEVAFISTKQENNKMAMTREYSNVTAHLLHHGTELWLKFAIFSKTKKLPKTTHNIFSLKEKCDTLYSEDTFYSPFDLPFPNETEKKKPSDIPFSEQYRYSRGKNNEPYHLTTLYTSEFLESYIKKLSELGFEINDYFNPNHNTPSSS